MAIVCPCYYFLLPKPIGNYNHTVKSLSAVPRVATRASLSSSGLVVTGPSELAGHVSISGSKNAALPILAAALCCSSGESRISNLPELSDIRDMVSVLRSLGAAVRDESGGGGSAAVVSAERVRCAEPDPEAVGRIRGGFLVVGPLLARFGEASVALPGGCDIGARPVDLYLRGLSALGAAIDSRDGKVRAYAENGRGLIGGRFRLDYPSVGATETLLMAASLADGVSVFSNVAKEPEVVELAGFLTECGARIEGAGTDMITVEGRPRLHGCEWRVSPDRIETGTFMIAAAITRSRGLSLSPVIPSHVASLTDKLIAAGCRITRLSHDTIEVSADGPSLRGFDIKTEPFPGFPTDLQPLTMALLTTCDGSSVVEELVFERRMAHANELSKLGARIQVCGRTALVFGKKKGSSLTGCSVGANDLRGGAALVLAGLAAKGTTEIMGSVYIDRGYENLDAKLRSLGANVKRLMPIPVLQE